MPDTTWQEAVVVFGKFFLKLLSYWWSLVLIVLALCFDEWRVSRNEKRNRVNVREFRRGA